MFALPHVVRCGYTFGTVPYNVSIDIKRLDGGWDRRMNDEWLLPTLRRASDECCKWLTAAQPQHDFAISSIMSDL